MPTGASRSSSERPVAPGSRADERVLRVFADPLTTELFGLIAARVVKPTTAALSAHTRRGREEVRRALAVLEECDVIEPVAAEGEGEDVPYRTTRDAVISDEQWARFTAAHRRQLFGNLLRHFAVRAWSEIERGGFDAHDTHVSWTPLDLDRRGYEDMVQLTLETLERARDVQAEVVQRRADGTAEGNGQYTDLMILHFGRGEATAAVPAGELDALHEQLHELSEGIADELAGEAPDTKSVAARARELASLVERLRAAQAV